MRKDCVLVVLNPTAGRGRAAQRTAELERAMLDAGVDYELARTGSPGQAVALAERAVRDGYAAIVAAGGDGTVNEVINGAALATPEDRAVGPIAVYPIGSGNDFAHTLKLDNGTRGRRLHNRRPGGSAAAVVCALVSAQPRRIDLGMATLRGPSGEIRRYFHNSLGYGLEASVTQESQRIQAWNGGVLYFLAALRALRKYEMPLTAIEWLDEQGEFGRMQQEITLISIGNARRTGGAFYLTPNALVDDALFDVAVGGAMSRLRLLTLLPRALIGRHTGARSVRMLRCRRIVARSLVPLPVHMDGEVVMADALEATAVVHAGRLEILV